MTISRSRMTRKMIQIFIFIILSKGIVICINISKTTDNRNIIGEHTIVTDGHVFPFMAAILKKSSYISAGALIDESWVLTGADSLFWIKESSRLIRVRLGSTNYKKGGYLTPIQFFEIHPEFDDSKPSFDVALIKLSEPVKLSPSMNPIRLQKRPKNVAATHFIIAAWPVFKVNNKRSLSPMDLLKRRILSVSHVHPTDLEQCSEELNILMPDYNYTKAMMCLDPGVGSDPCQKDAGAPVVLNGILWGIASSWKSEDCDVEGGPTFVTLVSAKEVSSWIHSTIHS